MSFGSKTQTTQQDTKRDPWAPAVPALNTVLGGAMDWYNNRGDRQFFPGQTYAGPSDATNSGISALSGIATDPNSAANQTKGFLGDTLAGKYLTGNPNFAAVSQSITDQVMPNIQAAFTKAGMYGSTPNQYSLTRGLSDAIAPYAYNNYESERGRQMQAASALPGLDEAMAKSQLQSGALSENYQQKGIDEAMTRYGYDQNKDLMALQQLAGFAQPIAGLGGTQNTNQTQQMKADPMSQIMGLGMMGASMFGGGGLFPGVGMGFSQLFNGGGKVGNMMGGIY